MKKRLTPKQEKFVQELLKGRTQRQAYKNSYNAKNMKDSTIDVKASQLLKQDKIRARFEELRGKAIKRAEEKAIITQTEIIQELVSIAKDDISNYLDFRTEKVFVDYDEETGEPVFDYRVIVDMKDSRDRDTKNISEISLGRDGSFKFKLYGRDKALFKLADIYGLDNLKKEKQKLDRERFEHEKEIDKKKYW